MLWVLRFSSSNQVDLRRTVITLQSKLQIQNILD